MSNSVRPHRRQPTRMPRPWDSPGKNTGVGCHFLLQCMKVKSESEVAQSCLTLSDPWTAAYQAPLSMGFSRQEYWSRVPLPSPITLYVRQQKRHRCKEQSFGLCGRGQGWDALGEWRWNMYVIICETNCQSRFDTWYRMLRAGALGWPRGMGWGGRWEGGSGWGTRVHPWRIHVNVWQNQYNIVK